MHTSVSRFTTLSLIAAVAGIAAISPAHCASKRDLSNLASLLKKKPLYVITNVSITGRMKSLFDEMKLTEYNEVDLQTSSITSGELQKASLLLLVDRDAGPLPQELEYLVPTNARMRDLPDTVILATQEKGGWSSSRTVYISAPTRDLLIEFIDDYVRDAGSLKGYSPPSPPMLARKPVAPAAPTVIFPRGTVRSTRSPVFFVVRRSPRKVVYDIQMSPNGREKDYRREDFREEGNSYPTEEGGWITFGAEVERATRIRMDAWGVKPPADLSRRNCEVVFYEPPFDIPAGTAYSVRVRGTFNDTTDAAPGNWSNVEELTVFNVAPQPANLGAAEALTRSDNADEVAPSFSADGSILLYATNRAKFYIWEVFADRTASPGTGSTRVTQSNRGSRDGRPKWGPIGESGIAYVTFERTENPSAGSGMTNIWYVAVPTEQHPNVPLGYTRMTSFPESSYSPAWTRDSKRLAFCKDRGGSGDQEIWLVEIGKNPRVLCNGVDPAWDVDGKTLYYSSNANGTWDIWKLDTTTGQQVAVTNDPGNEFSPVPNPSGNGDLAYVSTASGNRDIWILRQGVPVQLTQWLGEDIDPTWTPDGKRVVFATTRFSARLRYDLASVDPYGTATVPGVKLPDTAAPAPAPSVKLPEGPPAAPPVKLPAP